MSDKYCESCSMPMTKKEDFALGNEKSKYCTYCCDEEGNLKTYDEVFNGMVAFAMKNTEMTKEKAKEAVAQNMAKLPAWESHR